MSQAIVNGVLYDGASIKVTLPIGPMLMFESIEYSDEFESEAKYNNRNVYIGTGRGKYKADCKISMQMAEYEMLNLYSASFGGLYNVPPFPVIVIYEKDGIAVLDEITVKPKKRGKKGKAGDKDLSIDIECEVCGPIIWNGVPAYTSN
jgi:hypothetical protein